MFKSRSFVSQVSIVALAHAALIAGSAPAYAQATNTAAAAAAAVAPASEGDIVVTGAREAQRRAIASKRDADNVTETLEANDVGKLPDQNVAEAIKRLPGLSVANDQGEGRYVIIRGIDPALINVTLNGQTLPAPEPDGRSVKLDDLPSAMIQSVTVTKSLLPYQDANAVGGSVDIRTKTAFDDKQPFFFNGRASAGWYDMNHKSPYELDGSIGGRFGAAEQFGAVIAVNYSRRPIESENFQGSEDYDTYAGIPDGNGLRDYNLTRTRLGIIGNFDWHPSDTVKIYVRSSYSRFEDNETRDQNRLAVTKVSASGVISGTGTILVRRREENDNTKSATLGGEFADLAGGTLSLSGGWTRAEKKDPLRSEFTFTTKKGALTLGYDPTTDPYTLVPANAAAFTDRTLYTISKYNVDQRSSYEELWQVRADYTHPIAWGDDSSFAFGFKYLDRHKANDQNKTDYKSTGAVPAGLLYQGDGNFYDGMFAFGNRIDYDAARSYITANPSVLSIDTAGTLADSLSSDYDVKERITAGYAMLTLKAGALTLIPGIRVEHTVDRVAAKVVDGSSTLTDGFDSFARRSYTDVFPGVNAKFAFNDRLLLRAAVTTAIGRPNYPALAPYVTVEDATPADSISLGNPDLKPYRAINFDASLEFYPTRDSLFSAGVFHKQIDNPIYASSRREANATYGGVTYLLADVDQLVNFDTEYLTGVEVNAQTQFTALPGFLGGFGISANYAHIWGHADASSYREGKIPLAFQSHDVANVQLFYEKYGLAARLAFNYRSSYLDTVTDNAATDQYTDGNGQLDFHVSYQVTPQFTVFGDAINLTDAPWRRYVGSKDMLIERERYGAQLRGGVQVHF